MFKSILEGLFWLYLIYSLFMFGLHYLVTASNKPALVEMHRLSVERIAKAYVDQRLSVEPWIVIPQVFLVGLSMVIIGRYLSVSTSIWFLFSVGYLGLNLTDFDKYYLPGWELGERIRKEKIRSHISRALSSVDRVNKKKFENPNEEL